MVQSLHAVPSTASMNPEVSERSTARLVKSSFMQGAASAAKSVFPSWADLSTWAWYQKKLIKHFLPIGIIIALIWGLVWPLPGKYLANQRGAGHFDIMSTILISLIFFLQGMSLKTDEMMDAFKHPKSLVFPIISILGITGLYGFIMIRVPLTPDEFRIGAALFCVVPTTLTMGVTLVTQGNGNSALALLLTAGTNILGVGTTPFLFQAILNTATSGAKSTLNPIQLLIKLVTVVLGPCLIGKAARDLIPFVLKFANERKIAIGLTVNFFLIWIVWMSVSKAQHKFVTTPPKDIIVAALAMVALHLVWLAMNAAFCYILRLNKRDFRCCVILPSQKALPVVLTVVSFLPKELGNHGLMAIPPTVVYVAQLLIDSAVVAWWLAQDEKEDVGAQRARELQQAYDVEGGKKKLMGAAPVAGGPAPAVAVNGDGAGSVDWAVVSHSPVAHGEPLAPGASLRARVFNPPPTPGGTETADRDSFHQP